MKDNSLKTIMLASSNINKAKEYESILIPLGYRIITMKTLGVSMDGVNENGKTFEENSLIKAKYAYELIRGAYPVIADDSGISFDGLNGFPGIYSQRWNVNGDSSYETKNKEIIRLLKERENKNCHFTCVITYIDDNGYHQFKGIVNGKCASEPRQINGYGFGYDPIFELENGKTMAQIPLNEKDAISHRGKASQQLIEFLSKKN